MPKTEIPPGWFAMFLDTDRILIGIVQMKKMMLALAVPPIGTKLTAPDGTVLEVTDASPRRVRMVRVHRRTDDGDRSSTRPESL